MSATRRRSSAWTIVSANGAAIYAEAGGHYTSWSGEPTIRGADGVGTNAALHREVIDILRGERLKPGWKAKG